MDITERKNILSTLAQEEGESPLEVLNQETSKIAQVFENEADYNSLEAHVELLDAIAFRVPQKAVALIDALMTRLKTLQLTYVEAEAVGITSESMAKYSNRASLTTKMLSLLRHIRYYEPDKIRETFLEYFKDENQTVRKEAENGLKDIAGYHLNIFYSDGEGWPGLGPEPQERIIGAVSNYSAEKISENFFGIIILCTEILSPVMDDSVWSSKQVTIRSGAVPALDRVKQLRRKAVDFIAALYKADSNSDKKTAIIHCLKEATHTAHMVSYGDDIRDMIAGDTVAVLDHFSRFAETDDDLLIVQKIEHDAFWEFKRSINDAVRDAALRVKAIIDADEEYQIFKVLIGFEGVFEQWAPEPRSQEDRIAGIDNDLREAEKLRNRLMEGLADGINASNLELWTGRILKWSAIQSNDMATFPLFGKFLERFARQQPDLAMTILTEHADDLGGFITPLLEGVWTTTEQERLRTLAAFWLVGGKHLRELAAMFEYIDRLDELLLTEVCAKAVERRDIPTLTRLLGIIISHYQASPRSFANEMFFKAITALKEAGEYHWVASVWFRRELKAAIQDMEEHNINAILDSIISTPRLEHEVEGVLRVVGSRYPEKVIGYFVKRLAREGELEDIFEYQALPYQFYDLQETLSGNVDGIVDAVASLYDGNYGMFIHRGAKLVAISFPHLPEELQDKLISLAQAGNKDDLYVVLAILRNYKGEPSVQRVCHELVKRLPDGAKELVEVRIILSSTGVVGGEYGFVEAYEKKLEQISPWRDDPDQKVREFAQSYSEGLREEMARERKRADERILLRKAEYGELD